jgi:hypothetical protein
MRASAGGSSAGALGPAAWQLGHAAQHHQHQVHPGMCGDGSSLCGSSDLSAMANPAAYADTLRQRMAQHIPAGRTAGSTRGTSRGGASAGVAGQGCRRLTAEPEEGPASPVSASKAVRELDGFLHRHAVLQHKAGGPLWVGGSVSTCVVHADARTRSLQSQSD